MYEKYFGLREKPFSLPPDPDFLYLGCKHAMALTMLEYGITNDAPTIVISGEIGSGKTTLIRRLLDTLEDNATIGLISNTHPAFGELIQWVAMAFGLPFENREEVALYDSFVNFLIEEYARGMRTILIVDEAQNMSADTLEELRVLSNINADKNLVLQIILVGQPELRDTLRKPCLEQFAQRISVDYHLDPLDARETRDYIEHRLLKAGGDKGLFSRPAILLIHEYSAGVSRIINSLCDTAMVYAFAESRKQVTAQLVKDIVADKKAKGLFGAGKIHYENASNAELPT